MQLLDIMSQLNIQQFQCKNCVASKSVALLWPIRKTASERHIYFTIAKILLQGKVLYSYKPLGTQHDRLHRLAFPTSPLSYVFTSQLQARKRACLQYSEAICIVSFLNDSGHSTRRKRTWKSTTNDASHACTEHCTPSHQHILKVDLWCLPGNERYGRT